MNPAPRVSDRPRLHAQILRLQRFYLANRGRFFTLAELVRGIGASSEAGISARLREMTGEPYGWVKEKRIRSGHLWEYKMTPPKSPSAQLEIVL